MPDGAGAAASIALHSTSRHLSVERHARRPFDACRSLLPATLYQCAIAAPTNALTGCRLGAALFREHRARHRHVGRVLSRSRALRPRGRDRAHRFGDWRRAPPHRRLDVSSSCCFPWEMAGFPRRAPLQLRDRPDGPVLVLRGTAERVHAVAGRGFPHARHVRWSRTCWLIAVAVVRLPATRVDGHRRRCSALGVRAGDGRVYALVSCASLLGIFTAAYVQPCRRVLIILVFLGSDASPNAVKRFARRTLRRRSAGCPRHRPAHWHSRVWRCRHAEHALGLACRLSSRDHASGDAEFTVDGIWPETLARRASGRSTSHRGQRDSADDVVDVRGMARGPIRDVPPVVRLHHPRVGTTESTSTSSGSGDLQPRLVQTIRPTYTQYETWVEHYDWAFYEDLLDCYSVSSMTPWSIFWERRRHERRRTQLLGAMTFRPGTQIAALAACRRRPESSPAQTSRSSTKCDNPWRRSPIVGNSPRFLVGIDGAAPPSPVSLNPFVTQACASRSSRARGHADLASRRFHCFRGRRWTASLRVWQVR